MRRSSLALAVVVVSGIVVASPAAAALEQTPERGGTVVFGPVGESSCLNPFRDCGGSGPQFGWILTKVLPPAFALGPDFAQRPALVSGATFTRTAPYTLTYTIRREARWSDGVPVTARDFVFTDRAIREHLPPDEFPRTHVRSVRAVDAKTVRVVLKSRYAGWRRLFWFVLPQHALAGQDLTRIWTDRIDDPKTGKPIGYGPFLVRGSDPGRQITLVRNPNYWGPHKAYLDRLIIRFCQASCLAPLPVEVVESIRKGAVDFTYARDTEIVPDLLQIPDTTVRLHRTNGWEHLDFRLAAGGHPALRIKLVRQAFAYAIDRAQIVQRLWGGVDPSYRPLQSAVALETHGPWDTYVYRPDRARSLLDRAGCRRGADGIYLCGGQRLSFRLSTLPTRTRQRGIELMQAQLHRAGIEVVLSYSRGVLDQIFAGDFDVVSFAWILVDGFGQKVIYGCGGSANYTGYCQRLVSSDLDQADRIFDAAQRGRVLDRADRQLAKDVPVIPLYQIPWVYAYKDTIRNVVPSPDNLFWNAEDWWLDR